ncbi:MAG: hypothetical protein LUD48_02205 [Prevotella sp.]|nr:hypothetical protein [Prevotella sp.]
MRGRKSGDGRGRLGGREKGIPNSITTDIKTWIKVVLEGEQPRFLKNLKKLPPTEHVKAVIALLQYVIPKQAPINAADIIERERKMFLSLLVSSPETAVTDIAKKMVELNFNENEQEDEDDINECRA